MKLYRHAEVVPGQLLPDALIWSATDSTRFTLSEFKVDITMAGIRIPIPLPFWHDLPEYYGRAYGYWSLNLAIRRDDRPIVDGNLPWIGFAFWLSWRKPASQINTKMQSR